MAFSNQIVDIADGSISSIPISYTGNGSFGDPFGQTIQGKMLLHTHVISGAVLQDYVFQPEEVKQTMARTLAEEMLKNGFIEFTKTHEPHTDNWVFRARVFVVPDDKVRILRQNGY